MAEPRVEQGTNGRPRRLALVGHPNVGKSVVFARLTGRYVTCSNYPGTTVELYHGTFRLDGQEWEVIDTPGLVELASPREDEQVTRDLLLFGGIDAVVQVADGKNLERSMGLFVQLAELGLPMVLDLNMADERRACGIDLEVEELARRLGVPVVETVATSGDGVDGIRDALAAASTARIDVDYGHLEPALERIGHVLGNGHMHAPARAARAAACCGGCAPAAGIASYGWRPEEAAAVSTGDEPDLAEIDTAPLPATRGVAALLLALPGEAAAELIDDFELDEAESEAIRAAATAERGGGAPPGYEIHATRRAAALGLLEGVVSTEPAPAVGRTPRGRASSPRDGGAASATGGIEPPSPEAQGPFGHSGVSAEDSTPARVAASETIGSRLGRWTVHPVWGPLILLAVLFAIYQFVGNFGAVMLVGWFEETLFGEIINPAVIRIADRFVTIGFFHEMLVGEYGLFTMAITYAVALILPIVTTFFLAFGLLEDSGYFPRVSVMAHRLFAVMGLSGQAVLPMILGLSCDTMATVTTRVLETRKERIIATLLLALGVPCSAQLAVLLAMSAAVSPAVLLGVLGIVALQLLIVGRLAAIVLSGETPAFVAELPPLRWPQWSNIAAKTRLRLVWYVTEVLPLFIIGTLALFLFDQIGLLAAVEAAASPLVTGFLQLPSESSNAFVMGFFRRDYGAAGFYQLQQQGALDTIQVLVSLVVITLFVPCIANLLVIVKERGWRTAAAIVGFIVPYSILVGGVVNAAARWLVS